MPIEAILGIVGFAVFFVLWVVLPSKLHKKEEVEPAENPHSAD